MRSKTLHVSRAARMLARVLILTVLAGSPGVTALGYNDLTGTAPEGYVELYPVPETAEAPRFTEGAPAEQTVLAGKKILFYGDSLTAAYGLSSYDETWCAGLEARYGLEVTSISISASTFTTAAQVKYAPGGCYEPYTSRELPEGPFDIVFVQGGGNDWYCEAPMGSVESRDKYTFMGSVNLVIDRIQEKYPDAQILFMTSWNPVYGKNGLGIAENAYYDAMTEVCAARGVPCYQARNEALSGIRSADSSFRKQYFLRDTDYWHLNAAGQTLFLPVIGQWILDSYRVCGYTDVSAAKWFAVPVEDVTRRGLMQGMGNHVFSPAGETTRAQMITVLYRLSGSPAVTGTVPFQDVPAGAWYYDAVLWGYQQGVVKGVTEEIFSPDAGLPREQLVTMLARMENAAAENTDGTLAPFHDRDTVGEFARESIAWAVEHGIVLGDTNGNLAPKRVTSRAEMAAIFQRFLKLQEETA